MPRRMTKDTLLAGSWIDCESGRLLQAEGSPHSSSKPWILKRHVRVDLRRFRRDILQGQRQHTY